MSRVLAYTDPVSNPPYEYDDHLGQGYRRDIDISGQDQRPSDILFGWHICQPNLAWREHLESEPTVDDKTITSFSCTIKS
jgi:hypothetical protein